MPKCALVIEGGALRGVHTAGILDVFMRYNIRFPYVIGVSAGALNTYNYISNQPGRTSRILLEFIRDERYLNLKNIPNQKESAFGFDFMFYGLQEYLPFDMDSFNDPTQAFTVVATDLADGKPVYFRKGECSDIFKAGAASSSLPLISPPVELDGHRCMDGGVADPIPFLKAIEDGNEKVVVVLTRHKGFRKRPMPFPERETAKQLYKSSPDMLEAALTTNERYNATLDLLEELEAEGKIFVIRPFEEIDISLLERNTESLGALYRKGVRDAENSLQAMLRYLGVQDSSIQFNEDGTLQKERLIVSDSFSEDILRNRVKDSIKSGPRLTGNEAHKAFMHTLKEELRSMRVSFYSDPYVFRYQNETAAKFSLQSGSRTIHIPCKAVPYAGSSGGVAVEGEVMIVKDLKYRFLNARGKIAIIHIDKQFFRKSNYEKIWASENSVELPVDFGAQGELDNFAFLSMAKIAGVKGVVCVWDDDERLISAYCPYAQQYVGIPCVFVSGKEGKHLDKILSQNSSVNGSLQVEMETLENVWTETVYCVLPGTESNESVIINTHTEGLNAVEENGFAALLSLISILREQKLRRTHIFVFSSGRYRLPVIRTGSTSTGAIQKWLNMHEDLWDGKEAHMTAAAAISVEHLGDLSCPEVVFSSNVVMDSFYRKAVEMRPNADCVLLRARNDIFGEGQPLHNAGIPVLSFCADHLSLLEPSLNEMTFSEEQMMAQIQTILDILIALDETPKEAIGKSEKHPFLSQVMPDRITKVLWEDSYETTDN